MWQNWRLVPATAKRESGPSGFWVKEGGRQKLKLHSRELDQGYIGKSMALGQVRRDLKFGIEHIKPDLRALPGPPNHNAPGLPAVLCLLEVCCQPGQSGFCQVT